MCWGEKIISTSRLGNSCLILRFLKRYRSSHRKCRSSHRRFIVRKYVVKNFENFTLESFLWSCRLWACKFLKKRLQHKCFPVKFAKLRRTPILKSICRQLLLEVFYEKAVLKICNIYRTKVASDKCSVKKVFLVVDRAVKVARFYIDQHLLQKTFSWLKKLFFP